ncbi:hypothetical protein [Haloglomus litoreum]|uniref:hypothetical protein n=1 Tax=Haloglomus litoreum TaxID=3034026 RepID=UPI0023E7DEC8|nr:hypothetical protein [Haloglomus sp. DT116]
MSAVREPCPNCQLPFYTDRNDDCPYCGTGVGGGPADTSRSVSDDGASSSGAGGVSPVDTAPAGSLAGGASPSRPRVACSNCGLPHYADDDNGCPYCAAAGVEPDDTEPAPERSESPAESASATDTAGAAEPTTGERSGGLLSRIRGLFGG